MASSSSSAFMVAAFAAVLVLALGLPQAMAARSLGVVEWPCCRQYDAPPTVADVDIFLPPGAPALAPGVEAVEAETSAELATTDGAAGVDNAEPEWPCCRQYDTPPTVAADVNAQQELH